MIGELRFGEGYSPMIALGRSQFRLQQHYTTRHRYSPCVEAVPVDIPACPPSNFYGSPFSAPPILSQFAATPAEVQHYLGFTAHDSAQKAYGSFVCPPVPPVGVAPPWFRACTAPSIQPQGMFTVLPPPSVIPAPLYQRTFSVSHVGTAPTSLRQQDSPLPTWNQISPKLKRSPETAPETPVVVVKHQKSESPAVQTEAGVPPVAVCNTSSDDKHLVVLDTGKKSATQRDPTKPRRNMKFKYNCRECGELKRGHICIFK